MRPACTDLLERKVIVLRVDLKIFSRSTRSQPPGNPVSEHTCGALGTVTLVPRNSHVPARVEPVLKLDAGKVNPFPDNPGAKSCGGIASPRGDRIRFRRE